MSNSAVFDVIPLPSFILFALGVVFIAIALHGRLVRDKDQVFVKRFMFAAAACDTAAIGLIAFTNFS